ncbi:MAG: helix-turn-helix transcriptional regulator [Coriobacteriales bacterium]|jgi:DNA-binding CsgD family transcriptional regulator|nr:helix-turn-helix transcriptional regulator [Coriobacteriales bacterium]
MENTNNFHESKKRRTLLDDLAIFWPGIRYLSLGVCLSWIYLTYGGTVGLPVSEHSGANLPTIFLISMTTAAVILLLSPFCCRLFESTLASRSRVVLFSSFAVTGSLTIITGFYYVDLRGLAHIGAFLNGIGMAFLFLKCGCLYRMLKPRRALIYTALSFCLAPLVNFFVLGNKSFVFLEGGPDLGGLLAFVLLPLIASVLVAIPPPLQASDTPSVPDDDARREALQGLRLLPSTFWKFMVAIFIFTITASVIQRLVVGASTPGEMVAANDGTMLGRLVFFVAVFFYAVHFIQRSNLRKLYLVAMAILAAVMSIGPLFDIVNIPFALLVNFVFSVFDFLVWCLLAFVVYKERISPVIVFGFGRGVFMAGMSIGWYFGVNFTSILTGTAMGIAMCAASVIALLAIMTFVFPERDIDRMLPISSFPDSDNDFARWHESDELRSVSDASRQNNRETRDPERPFNQACKLIGRTARLSAREQDIFEQLALGRSSESVAKRLSISPNTVHAHTQSIYAKLDIHSRQELVEIVEIERSQFT